MLTILCSDVYLFIPLSIKQKPVVNLKFYNICAEQRNVFYLKVHKTGSTTFANILFNFGIVRNLSFPYGENGSKMKTFPPHPKDLTEGTNGKHKFNIIATHTILDMDEIKRLMPPGTKVVASFRHPLIRLQSAIDFFKINPRLFAKKGLTESGSLKTSTNGPLEFVLSNPQMFSKESENHYLRTYAIELGMVKKHIDNQTYVKEYLMRLDTVLDTPIITEHYEESLLLLKKKFCWSYKEIMYLPLRVMLHDTNLTQSDLQRHRSIDPSSYVIYEHFVNKLQRHLHMKGSQFQTEVSHYKGMLQSFKDFCICRCQNHWRDQDDQCPSREIIFAKSQFHKEFTIQDDVCQRLMISTNTLNHLVSRYQYQGYCRNNTTDLPKWSSVVCKDLPQNGVSFINYIKGKTGVPKAFECN